MAGDPLRTINRLIRARDVLGLPPDSQSVVALIALGILEGLPEPRPRIAGIPHFNATAVALKDEAREKPRPAAPI